MDRYDSVIFLITLFLVTNMLGLVAAHNIQQHEEIQETAEQHDSAASGVYLFVMIGISTALLLLLYRYNLNIAVRGWLLLALTMTTLLFFTALSESIYGFIATLAVVLGILYTDDHMLRNVLMMFPLAGAGAFFGSIFGFEAVLVLLVVLSAYDYFSVNISEHMVSLAKSGVETNTFMGFTYPKKDGGISMDDTVADTDSDGDTTAYNPVAQDQEPDSIERDGSDGTDNTDEDTKHAEQDDDEQQGSTDNATDDDTEQEYTEDAETLTEQDDPADESNDGASGTDEASPESAAPDAAEQRGGVGLLGGGDIVIPLIFASTVLADFGAVPAVVSILGAGTGLTFLLVKAKHGRFYPAIPPVAIGSVAGFGIGWLILQVMPAIL